MRKTVQNYHYNLLQQMAMCFIFWWTSFPRLRSPPLDPAGGLPSPDPFACAVLKFP